MMKSLSTRSRKAIVVFTGLGPPGPQLAYACNVDNTSTSHEQSASATDVLRSLFDGFLWKSVPKKRRSLERRRIRHHGSTYMRRYCTPKRNIVACLECGHWHEAHTICGNCYEKVKEETNRMRSAMDDNAYNYKVPTQEVVYVYKDEGIDREQYRGKYIVEVEGDRPKWWSKNMLTRENS